MRGEISYDLVMEDDMSFVEGAFRLPESAWQVFIFMKRELDQPQARACRWDSGVTGVVVRYPRKAALKKSSVEAVLSSFLGIAEWDQVRGPDSMTLR